MSLELALIEHGAPTLAGLKPGSLFRHCPADPEQFVQEFLYCRAQLAGRGVRLVILKGCRKTGSYLLYLFRQRALEGLLCAGAYRQFLLEAGYQPWSGFRDLLRHLAARLCAEGPFPHEIGVFLGYPLEDIQGFITHKGRNYTLCGCWKCYGDPREAQRRFDRFRRCTQLYRARYAQGASIRQLTAA